MFNQHLILQDVGDEEFRLLAALSQPLGFHKGKLLLHAQLNC
jgi:hypothetical protein